MNRLLELWVLNQINVPATELVPNKYYMSHGIKGGRCEIECICNTHPRQLFLSWHNFCENSAVIKENLFLPCTVCLSLSLI